MGVQFVDREYCRQRFAGKRIAIVGSGPGVLQNAPGFVDSHEVVVRVNNYKLSPAAGFRADVHYSFYGSSIKKSAAELKHDGVTLCMCKCPNAHAVESEWHRKNNQMHGVDWRPLYRRRADWWFTDTYIPTVEAFLLGFNLLGRHIPTTGFAAILDIVSFNPKWVYLTGFDFFTSRRHNVNEPWRQKNTDDPIGHVPDRELQWLIDNIGRYPITVDAALQRLLPQRAA